jgi:hypothetical protein
MAALGDDPGRHPSGLIQDPGRRAKPEEPGFAATALRRR